MPVDANGRVVREGKCESLDGVSLPWTSYRRGCRYAFQECENEKGKRYFRIFNGPNYGVCGPIRFTDLFTEI